MGSGQLDHSDADGDVDPATVQVERGTQGVGDAGGRCQRVGPVLQEHRELVATESGDGVPAAHRPSQAFRRAHQEGVAGGVAQRVVDNLEVVEVEEQDRDGT